MQVFVKSVERLNSTVYSVHYSMSYDGPTLLFYIYLYFNTLNVTPLIK